MKATLIGAKSNGHNYGGEKEMVSRFVLIAIGADGKMTEVVDARCWMGKSRNASQVYARIWVHGNGTWASGKGMAGGYGYHKISAAIGSAIESAGFKLDKDIHGVGDSAIREAMEAIAREIGFTGDFLIVD